MQNNVSRKFLSKLKANFILCFLATNFLLACQPAGKEQSEQKKEENPATTEPVAVSDNEAGFKPLFNGKNLDGWKVYGTEKWYAEDGNIICESGPDKQYGYLATTKPYKNFILELEFKQEENGNSGVFFRSSIEGTKITGWQVEVAPPGNDTGGIYESYGRGWLVQIPEEKEDILKMGEWNKMRIEVNGDKVTTYLNGEKMAELEDEKIGQANGSIALQIHEGGGIKVRWRNLKIQEL